MNHSKLKAFAVRARILLLDAVTQQAFAYEVTEAGRNDPVQTQIGGRTLTEAELSQRRELIARIRQCGFARTMEEAACIWFTRFIALRFLEASGFLPPKIRVFTDESGTCRPDLPDSEALYRYLLLAQCHALHGCFPGMFDAPGHWTELLLPSGLLHPDSVIARMVREIPEDDWRGQVQIIGWLYQYYNTEPKDRVFAALRRSQKIRTDDIPAATQLFTPDWIVRYMVENSLGRLWAEHHGKPPGADWQYLADVQESSDKEPLSPEQIRLIDPCMGTGHILVYAFDVLMQIYVSCGWTERDAAESILRHNLYGLDIDRRACQLGCFAVMMKARQYHRHILSMECPLHLAAFADVTGVNTALPSEKLRAFAEQFADAETIGSLLEVQAPDGLDVPADSPFQTMLNISRILSQQYDVVCTNPPYMGRSNMNAVLSAYVKQHYPDYKADLFSAFMVRCTRLAKPSGYTALLTPYVWMFLRSYERLRLLLYREKTIETLIQFEYSAFDAATVPICSFVLKNCRVPKKGSYIRLTDFRGGMEMQRRKALEALADPHSSCRYEADAADFEQLPGSPAAYWASAAMRQVFREGEVLKRCGDTRQGMATSDNRRFLRLWHEVDFRRLGLGCRDAAASVRSGCRWFPYNKGGDFRKWYGNMTYIVNYERSGEAVKHYAASLYHTASRTIKSESEYFKPCLSWSKISSGRIAFRYYPSGFLFDVAGCCVFYADDAAMYYDFGLLNSAVTRRILEILSPTMNFEAGQIASLPVIRDTTAAPDIRRIVGENVRLSREDWDAFETSWDFSAHPLI